MLINIFALNTISHDFVKLFLEPCMSKSKNKDQRSEHYQQKRYELYEEFNLFYRLANTTKKSSALTVQCQSQISKELKKWEEGYEQKFQKRPSQQLINRQIELLQNTCTEGLTTHNKIYVILRDDYNRQRFNGQGKKLLQKEIIKLQSTTVQFFLSSENIKNMRLLLVMEFIVGKLEELEKQQKIEKLETEEHAHSAKKPQFSIRDMLFSRSPRKNVMTEHDLSTHENVDGPTEDQSLPEERTSLNL